MEMQTKPADVRDPPLVGVTSWNPKNVARRAKRRGLRNRSVMRVNTETGKASCSPAAKTWVSLKAWFPEDVAEFFCLELSGLFVELPQSFPN